MNNKCICTVSCKLIGVISALFAGVVLGALYFFGILTAIIIPLQAVLAFGIIAFFGISAVSLLKQKCNLTNCLCRLRGILFTGAVGTILSSLIALLVSLTPGAILSAIVIGLVGFFLVLLIAAIICLVSCTADCD